MKRNRWDDAKVDTKLYLLLQDLTSVFSGREDFQFVYAYGSAVDLKKKEISGSRRLWDVVSKEERTAGYKTDVMLRAIGSVHLTNIRVFQDFTSKMNEKKHENFALQLASLFEDIRLEEIIRKKRPGTKHDFDIRSRTLKHYFSTQLDTNVTRGYPMDELFCLIYLVLHADEPDPDFHGATEEQLIQLERLKPVLFDMFAAQSTDDVTQMAERIVHMVEDIYPDMINDYLTFPIKQIESYSKDTLYDELTRTDPLANEDMEDVDEDNQEYFDQPFSTWHRENENNDRKQNFLQFELDVGTKTNIMGGDARETEDGDQAMGSVQGTSGKSEKNDYSEIEALDKQETSEAGDSGQSMYGEENKHAMAIHKQATHPTEKEEETYEQYKDDIDSYKRRLTTAIEKTLEHKRNAPTSNLLMGRLSKKLLSLVVEDNPRVFYKKSNESEELDAAFMLLVDCSASMHNKMEETKRGIVLFHEVLSKLHIPHSITGFWEDATVGTETKQPNYFHHVHDFLDSGYDKSGARIMQLEPEEDNRDGFSIRVMTEALMERPERHKFLLVFTDGEPAAMNYDQNGIVDTNMAVSEARKKGIEVVGMFLADGEVDEQEDEMMENIYGKKRLMVPSVSELPDRFAPLLKRLLFQGM